MDRFLRFIAWLVLLAILLAGFVFASFNTADVPLWLGRDLAARPVGQWVVGAFAAGGVIGLLLGLALRPASRRRPRGGREQVEHSSKPGSRLRDAEKELDALTRKSGKDGQ